MRAPVGAPDSDGIWAVTAALPEQVAEAVERAEGLDDLPDATGITSVVSMGMGGSGIGGDVVAALGATRLGVPVTVVKDYACPVFVGPSTLVIASSYSGNTEETLEAAGAAFERGARLVCVTSGGKLGEMAKQWGAPVLDLPSVPWPRCAFGALVAGPLVVLGRLGLYPDISEDLASAISQLRKRRDAVAAAADGHRSGASSAPAASSDHPAVIARRLGRTIPLVHGAAGIGAAAALRWKAQINENPKSPAFMAIQPELCHNEVAGWGQHGDATRQLLTLVMLRHSYEHPQVSRRFELIGELVDEVVASVIEVRAGGTSPLAQLFDLVLVGDFVSLELAAAEGVDPGPIPVLMDLKEALGSPPRP